MGPRVAFAPALLTLHFISSRLLVLLYVTCVMVNKAVKKKKGERRMDRASRGGKEKDEPVKREKIGCGRIARVVGDACKDAIVFLLSPFLSTACHAGYPPHERGEECVTSLRTSA